MSGMAGGDFITQLMQLLAGSGPTGYTKDIRQNLGMDIPQGGAFKTSGMTHLRGPQGYVPRKVLPDPKIAAVPYKPVKPVAPVTPVMPPVKPPVGPPGYTFLNGQWYPNALLPGGPRARQPISGGANSR